MTFERQCAVRRLHLVTYENGMAMQEKLVAERQREEIPDQLLLLQHPPVITLGRGGNATNLLADPVTLASRGVRYYESTRGGDITWHGPGQIVGYPIIHLGEGRRDVRKYVTKLEEVLIRTANDFGIAAGRVDGQRGIWAGNEKLAAIGVRIARWVTSHGFALNVAPDLSHFDLITPCGIQGVGVTSMARLSGMRPARDEVVASILGHFADIFERDLVETGHDIEVVKVVIRDGQRVLLLHRHPHRGDFWQPLTGTMEPGELPDDTAEREITEETGWISTPVRTDLRQSFVVDSPWVRTKYGRAVFADEITYVAELDSSLPIRLDPEEHDDWGWFTVDEALERITWTADREAILRVFGNCPRGSEK